MADYRIIVAGCGSITSQWLPYTLERKDAEIIALVDIDLNQAEGLGEKYGLACPVYRDIGSAIDASGGNLVYCLASPEAHSPLITDALNRGCHVFTEKPLAASMEEARGLVSLAGKQDRRLSVMQNRRYNKNIRALRDLISSGSMGSTGMVTADFFLSPRFGGFRDEMASPLLLDMAIHTFDQLRFLTGADAKEVFCEELNLPGSWYRGDASAVSLFRLSDGSVFSYRGCWSADGFPTSWESEWRIAASKGTALWDGEGMPRAQKADPAPEGTKPGCRPVAVSSSWKGLESHQGCLEEMFAALTGGRKAETDCTDNIRSLAMVFGAVESSQRKQWVDVKGLWA